MVNNNVVGSAVLTGDTPAGSVVRFAYQTFASIALPTGTQTPLSLRLRSVAPTGCLNFEVDRTNAGTLTLVGQR
jgi:hypothetical protein